MKKPQQLRLYFVCDADEFETDFVIAPSEARARALFRAEYGDNLASTVELVKELEAPLPAWVRAMWVGPDDPCLEQLGGERIDAVHFPQWKFGDKAYGCKLSAQQRYGGGAAGEFAPCSIAGCARTAGEPRCIDSDSGLPICRVHAIDAAGGVCFDCSRPFNPEYGGFDCYTRDFGELAGRALCIDCWTKQ